MDADERAICLYLRSLPGQWISATEIARRACGKRRFRDEPTWAAPIIARLVDQCWVESDSTGHYRLRPLGRKGKPKKWISPLMSAEALAVPLLVVTVTVTSEVYGTRHGIATSRRAGGSTAESEFPWEVAETSAIGRALTAMGYGLLPGAGLASAEDMLRATGASASKRIPREAIPQRSNAPAPVTTSRRQPPLSAVQRQKLTQLYQQLHHGSEAEVARGLDALFTEAFSHAMSEATYEEGSRLTAQLMAQSKETSPA